MIGFAKPLSDCRAAKIVPDPGGELAAYLRRQAAAEGFEQMNLILRRAHQRGEIDAGSLSTQVARLPVTVLHSELCLGTTPVSDRLITEIVDEVFLPLAAGQKIKTIIPNDAGASPTASS